MSSATTGGPRRDLIGPLSLLESWDRPAWWTPPGAPHRLEALIGTPGEPGHLRIEHWFAGQARPESGLKIVGASNGEILRRSAGGDAPLLHLEVRGHALPSKGGNPGPGTEVVWLINGRPSARQPASKGFEQRLTEPGRYDITVLDDSGAYDRISLSVR